MNREVLGNLGQLVTIDPDGPRPDHRPARVGQHGRPIQAIRSPVRLDDDRAGDGGAKIGLGPIEEGLRIEPEALEGGKNRASADA